MANRFEKYAQEGNRFARYAADFEQPQAGDADGFMGAVSSGVQRTLGALRSTWDTYTGDTAGVEQEALGAQGIAQTPEQRAFSEEVRRRSETQGDDSVWQGIKNVAGAAADEPLGALHEVAAQLPNSAVTLGGMYAGAKLGAVAGSAGGPVGTVIGTFAGGLIGMLAGNTAVETGYIAQGKADDGTVTDEELSEAGRQGFTKGAVITAVDSATIGLNRWIGGGAGRAVEDAIAKTLADRGVDVTSEVAVKAALSTKEIARAATEAGALAFEAAATTGKQAARGAAKFGLETAGEGVGEYAGSAAAGLDASFTEAAMESLLSVPQSVTEMRVSKKLETPGRLTGLVSRAANVPTTPPTPPLSSIPVAERAAVAKAAADQAKADAERLMARPLDPYAATVAEQNAARQAEIDAAMPGRSGPEVNPRLRQQTYPGTAPARQPIPAGPGVARPTGLVNSVAQQAAAEAPGAAQPAGALPRLPDDPMVVFRDGTVARKGEIEAEVARLEAAGNPQAAADLRAKVLGYAPQAADTQGSVPDTQGSDQKPVAYVDPRLSGISAIPDQIVQKNGKPYATEKSAVLAAKSSKLEGYSPVQVDGGFALERIQNPATTTATGGTPVERQNPAEITPHFPVDAVATPASDQQTLGDVEIDPITTAARTFSDQTTYHNYLRGRLGKAEFLRRKPDIDAAWNARTDDLSEMPKITDVSRETRITPEERRELTADRRQKKRLMPRSQERRQGERRQDIETRKRVEHMTPDELRQALLTDDLTGLGNRRAYDESEKMPIQVAIDLDGLKFINDTYGHDAGDQFIAEFGVAVQSITGDGYHLSGDEFMVQAINESAAIRIMREIEAAAADIEIAVTITKTGEEATVNGVHFSYGIGQDKAAADKRLYEHKDERKRSGIRKDREPDDGGSVEAPPAAQVQGSAQEEEVAESPAEAGLSDSDSEDEAETGQNEPTPVPKEQELSRPPRGQRSEPANPPSEKIEDFGEKIGGARKDVWQSYAQRLAGAKNLDTATQPLSKSWPEPDYQALLDEGADPWAVAFIRAMRDEVPDKPRKAWRVRSWAAQVDQLRDMADNILSGETTKELLLGKLSEKEFSRLGGELLGRVDLYQAVGHARSLKGVRLARAEFSLLNGVEYKPAKVFWVVERGAERSAFSNMPQIMGKGDTREQAIQGFVKAVESGILEPKKQTKKQAFDIYSYRGGEKKGRWFIGKKIGKDYVDLESFEDVKAAREYLAGNADKLAEKLERMKYVPAERNENNAPRVGVDHRNGANVTPEQFQETFGFRGVQFGNYVENAKRQQDLNEAYDALMDMAGILNVPTRALSLNGELGLAFGARGKGAAGRQGGAIPAAHYERGEIVINLTKNKGAGSLAHEWWHSLDNYFSRLRSKGDDYATEALDVSLAAREANFHSDGSIRREMILAFGNVVRAVNKSKLIERSRKLDKTRTKAYWSTGREMTARSFESYIIERLKDQGASNDYLANIVSEDYWNAAAALGLEKDGTYPYPEAAEIPDIRAAFDGFFRTVQTKETDRGVAMYSRKADSYETAVDGVLDEEIDQQEAIEVGGTPDVLLAVNAPDLPLYTTGDIIDKVHYDHGLTRAQIKRIPDLLADPVYVFESESQPGSFVVVLDETVRGKPFLAVIHPDRKLKRAQVNFIASAYAKDNANQIKRWAGNGLLRYVNTKKSPGWQTIVGVQFPEMGPAARGSGTKIVTDRDVVNNGGDSALSRKTIQRVAKSSVSDLESALRKPLSSISKLFPVNIVQSVSDLPGDHPADVRGMFANGAVWLVADNLPANEAAAALAHEAVGHLGLETLLGPQMFNDLVKMVQQQKRMGSKRIKAIVAQLEKSYTDADGKYVLDARQEAREILAHIAEGKADLLTGSALQKLYQRIKAKVRLWLASKGFGNMEDALIDSMIARAARMVQGEYRGAGTTEGALAYQRKSQTETPEFRRWFGDSKVVDESGAPLVVYHGTLSDVQEFDPATVGTNFRSSAGGFFFTGSSVLASAYAKRRGGEGGNVIPAFLSLKNPLTLEDAAYAFGGVDDGLLSDFFDRNAIDVIRYAQENGNDGIYMVRGDDVFAVAFRPEQIKSAIGNRGTFDPNDPNIAYSRRTAEAAYDSNAPINPNPSQRTQGADPFSGIAEQADRDAMLDPLPAEAEKVQSAIEGKSPQDAARFIIKNGSKAQATIAERILLQLGRLERAGVNLDLKVAHVGDSVPVSLLRARGLTAWKFATEGHQITVWINGTDVTGKVGMSHETVLHELVHMATVGIVHLGNLKAAAGTKTAQDVTDLYAVTNHVIKHFNQRVADSKAGKVELTDFENRVYKGMNNALRDPDEVLAWALTNADAQSYLESIPYPAHTSAWSAFVSAIRNLLGIPAKVETALSEVLRIAENLMSDNVNDLLGLDTVSGENEAIQAASGSGFAAQENSAYKRKAKHAEAASPYADLNRRIREEHVTAWDKARTWLKRQLSPGGLLPDQVFKEKIKRDSEFEVIEFDVAHLVGQLERAVKADYGTKAGNLDETVQRLLSDVMAGNVAQDVPERTKVVLLGMRQYIDRLSMQYAGQLQAQANQAIAESERLREEQRALSEERNALEDTEENEDTRAELLAEIRSKVARANAKQAEAMSRADTLQTILNNLGEYVNRSYRAFDDKDWARKVPDKVLDDARAYLLDRYAEDGMDDAEAARRAEVVLNEILKHGTAYESMDAFIQESKLGAKDLSILKRRKQIAPQIRALLGEYTDPRITFAKSATKMGRLIWNQTFLDRVLEIGTGTFLWTDETKPPEATAQIATDASEAYAPLNGLWTTPEINQAFKDALGKEQMADWYRTIVQMNGIVKWGKTVLSPTTAARNWMSAFFFAVANGHFDMRHMAKSVQGLREYFTQNGEAAKLAYLRKLKHLGVVYDTPYAGEMMRLLEDSRVADKLVMGKGRFDFKSALDLATKFYQYGDDFWKIIGFENEKRQWMKAGLPEAEAEVRAAERVRNTYPTYSMVGRGIQSLRRFPLAGTFVSFPAEIIRTTGNMLRYLAADMKDPQTRPMAMRRAAGLAIASGFAYGLQALSMALLGMDDDDDEAVRRMAAPWQRNSNLIYTGRDKDGNIRYLDVSFLDPYNYWKRPIMAITRNQPWEDSARDVAKETLTPFFGTDIAAGAIFEVLANRKESGAPVYNEHDEVLNQTAAIADHLRKNLQPGIASNLERTWKALNGDVSPSGRKYSPTDEAAAWVGFRMSTLDPKVALYYRSFDFKDAKAEADKKIRDVIRKEKKVDSGDLRDAWRLNRRLREKAYREMNLLVSAAMKAGMSRKDIMDTLKNSGVSGDDRVAILNGKVPKYRPSERVIKDQAAKARTTFGPDAYRETIRRYREVLSLESAAN